MTFSVSQGFTEFSQGFAENKTDKMKFIVDENGYYGDFGGAWIPEMMYANINELRIRYLAIIQSPGGI
jgi:hypothetical protein